VATRDDRTFVHRIDSHNVIVDLNRAWLDFAIENDAPELTRDAVVGRSLWDFIAGWEVRYIYEAIIRKVRKERVLIRVPFRCDSPGVRRYMDVDIVSAGRYDGDIEFRSRIIREEVRLPVDLLKDQVREEGEEILLCSWCKRIKVDGERWSEAETALGTLRLSHDLSRPRLAHDVCPECRPILMQATRPSPPL